MAPVPESCPGFWGCCHLRLGARLTGANPPPGVWGGGGLWAVGSLESGLLLPCPSLPLAPNPLSPVCCLLAWPVASPASPRRGRGDPLWFWCAARIRSAGPALCLAARDGRSYNCWQPPRTLDRSLGSNPVFTPPARCSPASPLLCLPDPSFSTDLSA